MSHETVLLNEAVTSLLNDLSGVYVDGTFGRGGHSRLILSRLHDNARLIGIDKDVLAIKEGERLACEDQRFSIIHGAFDGLQDYLESAGLKKVSGILLDLGVSSPQLDEAERGFSFLNDGPLDMRMDVTRGQTAAEWLAIAKEEEIAKVLKEYGEEKFARRMARAICEEREEASIDTTAHLARVVSEANPAWEKGKHPATRAFQAIRIHINDELSGLQKVLQQAVDALAVGGRLVVISFHSLEDRMVKRFMRDLVKGPYIPKGVPVMHQQVATKFRLVGKAIKPSDEEVERNPRARSAVMRTIERVVA